MQPSIIAPIKEPLKLNPIEVTMVVVLGYCLIGGMRLRSQNNGKEAFTMLYVHLMSWSPSLPWYVPFISGN